MGLLLSSLPALAAGEAQFSDIEGRPDEAAILQLHALGAINGYMDGNYHPADPVTRAEFAVILVRALGHQARAAQLREAAPFTDLAGHEWAKGSIAYAATQNWLGGYPDGRFAPAYSISVEEMAVVLMRVVGVGVPSSTPWYQGAVDTARSLGLIDETFVVGRPATRGQVASAVVAALGQLKGSAGRPRLETERLYVAADAADLRTVRLSSRLDLRSAQAYNLTGAKVYGDLAVGAAVELVRFDGSIVMARALGDVRAVTLAEDWAGRDYIVVNDGRADQVYYEARPGLFLGVRSMLTSGAALTVSFDELGRVIAVSPTKTPSTMWPVEAKLADRRLIVDGETYTLMTGAIDELSLVFEVDGEVLHTLRGAAAWSALSDGDLVQLEVGPDGRVTAASAFARRFTAKVVREVNSASERLGLALFLDGEEVSGSRFLVDRRLYPSLTSRTFALDDLVTVSLNEDASRMLSITYQGRVRLALQGQIISGARVDRNDRVTLTVGSRTYEVARDATLKGSLQYTPEYGQTKELPLAWDRLGYNEEIVAAQIDRNGQIVYLEVYKHELEAPVVARSYDYDDPDDLYRRIELGSSGVRRLTSDATLLDQYGRRLYFNDIRPRDNANTRVDERLAIVYLNSDGDIYWLQMMYQ